MRKNICYTIMAAAVFYLMGVAGGLERETLTLTGGIIRICIAVAVAGIALKTSKGPSTNGNSAQHK